MDEITNIIFYLFGINAKYIEVHNNGFTIIGVDILSIDTGRLYDVFIQREEEEDIWKEYWIQKLL